MVLGKLDRYMQKNETRSLEQMVVHQTKNVSAQQRKTSTTKKDNPQNGKTY